MITKNSESSVNRPGKSFCMRSFCALQPKQLAVKGCLGGMLAYSQHLRVFMELAELLVYLYLNALHRVR